MKLLYLVPNINNAGGVARVLSIKTNYLIEHFGYEVHIFTQNNGSSALFYPFNQNIVFHDMLLTGTAISRFNLYQNALKAKLKVIQPDIIIVCDNGLKAYLIPFILKNKIPLILEMHSSRFIEEKEVKKNILTKITSSFRTVLKNRGIKKYDQFVVLTSESGKEWNVKNTLVIPNPLWFTIRKHNALQSKKVIAVGRHTYEKGFDRMLAIWKKVVINHPDWTLDIYGKSTENLDLRSIAKNLNIYKNVTFHEPVQDIEEKYLEASFYLMTSRFEAFGMVLIEAMAAGLPCVAYDCPSGPREILTPNENAFLIENGKESDYVQAVVALIENATLRQQMGENAKLSSEKYNIDVIMQTWDELFIRIKKN